MKKTNKLIVVVLFILSSAALFFIMWEVFGHFYLSGDADVFTQMGQALTGLPYLLEIFALLLVIAAFVGKRVSRRRSNAALYKGFQISFIFSFIVALAVTLFLIYCLRQ